MGRYYQNLATLGQASCNDKTGIVIMPCTFSPYIMLVHLYDSHLLPSTATTLEAAGTRTRPPIATQGNLN